MALSFLADRSMHELFSATNFRGNSWAFTASELVMSLLTEFDTVESVHASRECKSREASDPAVVELTPDISILLALSIGESIL